MESLQNWGLMGEIYIGCGFIRGKLAGVYYDILGQVGGRLAAGRRHRRVTAGTPARRGRSFSVKKSSKRILGQDCSRLTAGRSHRRVTACTPARRGPTFL